MSFDEYIVVLLKGSKRQNSLALLGFRYDQIANYCQWNVDRDYGYYFLISVYVFSNLSVSILVLDKDDSEIPVKSLNMKEMTPEISFGGKLLTYMLTEAKDLLLEEVASTVLSN